MGEWGTAIWSDRGDGSFLGGWGCLGGSKECLRRYLISNVG